MNPHAQRFFAALAGMPAKEWVSLGKLDHLFDEGTIDAAMFTFIDGYAKQHGKTPSVWALEEQFGASLPKDPGEAPFLHMKLQEGRIRKRLSLVSASANELLKGKDAMGALQALTKEITQLNSELSAPKAVDFKNAYQVAWPWLIEKWAGTKTAMPIYWEKLDTMTGGVFGGEVVSLVGRPGLGKTWKLLMQAMHTWRTTNRPVVFVSMEIMARKLIERLIALYTETPADFYKDGISPTMFVGDNLQNTVKKDLKQLQNSDRASFIVVDGNLTATADDVAAMCQRYEASACFVDGAYMLRSASAKHLKGFERIEEVCNSLKRDTATSLDLPVCASWQFNREASKMKPGAPPMLEHIAGGDTIGMVSSIVLGLVDEPTHTEGKVEEARRRRVHIIKGRDGETGSYLLNWNFSTMNFSEIPTDEFGEPLPDEEVYGLL